MFWRGLTVSREVFGNCRVFRNYSSDHWGRQDGRALYRLGDAEGVGLEGAEEAANRLSVHRPAIAQRQPASHDPVDRPDAGGEEDGQRDGYAHQRDEQRAADHAPEQREPERADLPAEVRLEERAARLRSLHVVDD